MRDDAPWPHNLHIDKVAEMELRWGDECGFSLSLAHNKDEATSGSDGPATLSQLFEAGVECSDVSKYLFAKLSRPHKKTRRVDALGLLALYYILCTENFTHGSGAGAGAGAGAAEEEGGEGSNSNSSSGGIDNNSNASSRPTIGADPEKRRTKATSVFDLFDLAGEGTLSRHGLHVMCMSVHHALHCVLGSTADVPSSPAASPSARSPAQSVGGIATSRVTKSDVNRFEREARRLADEVLRFAKGGGFRGGGSLASREAFAAFCKARIGAATSEEDLLAFFDIPKVVRKKKPKPSPDKPPKKADAAETSGKSDGSSAGSGDGSDSLGKAEGESQSAERSGDENYRKIVELRSQFQAQAIAELAQGENNELESVASASSGGKVTAVVDPANDAASATSKNNSGTTIDPNERSQAAASSAVAETPERPNNEASGAGGASASASVNANPIARDDDVSSDVAAGGSDVPERANANNAELAKRDGDSDVVEGTITGEDSGAKDTTSEPETSRQNQSDGTEQEKASLSEAEVRVQSNETGGQGVEQVSIDRETESQEQPPHPDGSADSQKAKSRTLRGAEKGRPERDDDSKHAEKEHVDASGGNDNTANVHSKIANSGGSSGSINSNPAVEKVAGSGDAGSDGKDNPVDGNIADGGGANNIESDAQTNEEEADEDDEDDGDGFF